MPGTSNRSNLAKARTGFTGRECLILLVVSLVAIALLVIVLPTPTRRTAATEKDGYHVRGVVASLEIWANANDGRYPLPSLMDPDDATVADRGASKDHTANLYSIMIWNALVPTEMLVSPMEPSRSIEADRDYQFDSPEAAVDPSAAMWDPGFTADFSGGGRGNTSYAHMLPCGPRLHLWSLASGSHQSAVVGNRGPEIQSVQYEPDGDASPQLADRESITLGMYGNPDAWEGFIGYVDGHVDYERNTVGGFQRDGPRYRTDSGSRQDVVFFDEPDDAHGTNNFLGIFTTAGLQPPDFTAIWD